MTDIAKRMFSPRGLRWHHRCVDFLRVAFSLSFPLFFFLFLCLVLASGTAFAEDASDEEFHIDTREIKIHVNADGSSVTEWYEVTTLLTETGIDW